MSRRSRKKDRKVALIVIVTVLVVAALSGAGYTLRDFIVAEIMLVILVVAIIVFVIIWNLPTNKGKRGENRIAYILEKMAYKYGGYVINDVIIPNGYGATSQIDHVFISHAGIYVVETKNYSGRLYGSEKQEYWTQVLTYGNTKNKMYNPLLQNQTHINNLRHILGNNFSYYSCVVILRADLGYLDAADKVFTPHELKTTLKLELQNNEYDDEQIGNAFNTLNEYKINPIATNKVHISNIKKTQKDIENNICPRCGGSLILRKGQNGAFYGCSNYPKCKFTKKT